MTDTTVETIEHLDFDHAPECEYSHHDEVGGGPATLAVRFTRSPCGCKPPRTRTHCADCFTHYTGQGGGLVGCTVCRLEYPIWPCILAVVRL